MKLGSSVTQVEKGGKILEMAKYLWKAKAEKRERGRAEGKISLWRGSGLMKKIFNSGVKGSGNPGGLKEVRGRRKGVGREKGGVTAANWFLQTYCQTSLTRGMARGENGRSKWQALRVGGKRKGRGAACCAWHSVNRTEMLHEKEKANLYSASRGKEGGSKSKLKRMGAGVGVRNTASSSFSSNEKRKDAITRSKGGDQKKGGVLGRT